MLKLAPKFSSHAGFDTTFLEDMKDIFLGFGSGQAGKYMYNDQASDQNNNLWEEIVHTSSEYYVPQADKELLEKARKDLSSFIPQKTPYIDFGVGCLESIQRYAVPTMRELGTREYFAVDCEIETLSKVKNLSQKHPDIKVKRFCFDFFKKAYTPLQTKRPGLGVMNGITLTNMYGHLSGKDAFMGLSETLKNLLKLTNHGWLLVSIDTNQNENEIMEMYSTPLNSTLNIASLSRMQNELPAEGFNASLFDYTPEWHEQAQLLAHLAKAKETQTFLLDDQICTIEKGEQIHLFNSYKFNANFFEAACRSAHTTILRKWEHDSGVSLYLIKDNREAASLFTNSSDEKCKILIFPSKKAIQPPCRGGCMEYPHAPASDTNG